MEKISATNPNPKPVQPKVKPYHCRKCGGRLQSDRLLLGSGLGHCEKCDMCKRLTPFEMAIARHEVLGEVMK